MAALWFLMTINSASLNDFCVNDGIGHSVEGYRRVEGAVVCTRLIRVLLLVELGWLLILQKSAQGNDRVEGDLFNERVMRLLPDGGAAAVVAGMLFNVSVADDFAGELP